MSSVMHVCKTRIFLCERTVDGHIAFDLEWYVVLGGYMAKIAVCLEDGESRIADLARLFFAELKSETQNEPNI